ncbi:hypothetical protein FWG86_00615 [Candidatus Saccharibacteria bacterium]|nr:hypothetical protein [Candidatus Saccharibacteria bacterium]
MGNTAVGADKEKSYMKMKTQTEQLRYEFTNQDTIVLRKNGVFHKAMGNSAIILKSMGVETKVRTGFSQAIKQETFELSVHMGQIEELKRQLREKCKEVLREDGDFFIIRLKEPIPAEKLKQMKKSAIVKIEATESILMRKRKETPLAKEVRDLFSEATYLARALHGVDGQCLARMILEQILALQRAVRALMREEGSDAARQAVLDAADDVQGLLLLVVSFTEQADRLARMGRGLNRIISRV